ncbi:MAG: hypothetical protein M3R51_05860 [Candidatus Eremiobacteraeota bacterium]|nr:hypothetical protein [Candidatus Eremiobacteraeota bacterium]
MLRLDPRDRRYRERLAGSSIASIVLHAVFAALMVSIAVNSAQSGASEDATGAEIVTVEHRASESARSVSTPHQVRAIQRVAQTSPLRRGEAQPPAHRLHLFVRPELSKIVPSAPPIATPLPQATPEPNPEPTIAAYETKPQSDLPAVPSAVPAQIPTVTVKVPPKPAPSAAPVTAAPSAAPVRTAPPATPAPVASPAPAASARPDVTPAPPQNARGAAVTPGPAGRSSPGPRPGSAVRAAPGNPRPINVPPTPRAATPSSSLDLNARLRAMLPHNAVIPTQKTYRQTISLNGRLEPTPPPTVLAATKFTFEERGTGGESRIKMWVTSVNRRGGITFCEGWLLRYPISPSPGFMHPFGTHIPDANGSQIGGVRNGELAPIVESSASTVCSERSLVPFVPAPVPSP